MVNCGCNLTLKLQVARCIFQAGYPANSTIGSKCYTVHRWMQKPVAIWCHHPPPAGVNQEGSISSQSLPLQCKTGGPTEWFHASLQTWL